MNFVFTHKYCSGVLHLSADSEREAFEELLDVVKDIYCWRVNKDE